MDLKTFRRLHHQGLLSDDSLLRVEKAENNRLFSLHWELKTLLYLGVLLFSGGLGILVYKNIDTIGHGVILTFIALISVLCFFYCGRKAPSFALYKVSSPDPFFDYILLLGSLTLIIFIAYLQYAYSVFENRYGLATFIPMVILFISAYRFDHLGVLSMAITNLAAWLGITVAPLHILRDNHFSDLRFILTGFLLGIVLLLAAYFTDKKNIKKHFDFTYNNFGTHILFIAGLAAMFSRPYYFIWFLLLTVIAYFIYQQAMRKNSFYFFLLVVLYGYIALSFLIIQVFSLMIEFNMDPILFGLLYFILSAVAMIRLLAVYNQKMKTHDRLQPE